MDTPPPMERWVAFELGRLNAGLVTERKSLARLRAEAQPSCRTKDGMEHPFEREALERLAAVLTTEEAEGLRLPIVLFATGDLENNVYVTDEVAAKALRALEGFGPAFPFREGRMYLPHALALDLVGRSGGTLQLAFA